MHGTAPKAITLNEAYREYEISMLRLITAADGEIREILAYLHIDECELVYLENTLHLDNAKRKSKLYPFTDTYPLSAGEYRRAQEKIQHVLDRLDHVLKPLNFVGGAHYIKF